MYLVLLTFSDNKARAGELMAEHKAWIQCSLDEGIFLLVGSLQPNRGGAILVRGIERDALEQRINADPFVRENVVSAEVVEFTPHQAGPHMQFLLA